MSVIETDHFESLIDYLNRSRGFDFGGYNRAGLGRRIQKRMQMIGVNSYGDYIDYLEVHPDEFTHLFNTILINVTGFFRDPAAWEFIQKAVVPHILDRKQPGEPIRIWSAGVASGEEAYTLAMIMAEALGSENISDRVKIYATDIDEDALNKARQATYTEKEVEGIPDPFLDKYFDRTGGRYVFHKDLRRAVIFGRHDITQDAPISRIDLLVCRNLLMYLNAEAQNRVLARLHFALADSGYLFLGRAEMLLTHTNIFTPVDLKNRIFTRVPKMRLHDRMFNITQPGGEDAMNSLLKQVRLRDAVFDTTPIAQVIIDTDGIMNQANQPARQLFGLNPSDLGHPFKDLSLSYRPVELRSYIERAYNQAEPIHIPDVEINTTNRGVCYVDIDIHTLFDTGNAPLGVVISFFDITEHKKLQNDLTQVNQELETALEELQSTNEELETTNEELQSTIEELETTNEELQSSNEELETMNEELHSSNEELETVNEEMRQRTGDLNHANAFLESILTSMRGGVIVVNSDLDVQVWNRKAEDLWGLRPEEVQGSNLLNLDIGLPVEHLKRPLRSVVSGSDDYQEVIQDATNRRGRQIRCKVTIAPLFDPTRKIQGAIIVTEEVDHK